MRDSGFLLGAPLLQGDSGLGSRPQVTDDLEYILAAYDEISEPDMDTGGSGGTYFISGGRMLLPGFPAGLAGAPESDGTVDPLEFWTPPGQEWTQDKPLVEESDVYADEELVCFSSEDVPSSVAGFDVNHEVDTNADAWIRHKNLLARNEGLLMDTMATCDPSEADETTDGISMEFARPAGSDAKSGLKPQSGNASQSSFRFIPSPGLDPNEYGALVRQPDFQPGY